LQQAKKAAEERDDLMQSVSTVFTSFNCFIVSVWQSFAKSLQWLCHYLWFTYVECDESLLVSYLVLQALSLRQLQGLTHFLMC